MPGYFVQWHKHSKSKEVSTPAKQAKNQPINSALSKHYQNEFLAEVTKPAPESSNNVELQGGKRVPKHDKETIKKITKSDNILEQDTNTFQTSISKPVKEEKKRDNGDGLMYLVSAFMALVTMGLFRGNRSTAMKVTRWAKANPKKTQGLIAGLQLPLMGLGIMAGHNLKEMGFELSDTMMYVFGTMAFIGFLSVPFSPKRSTVAIPKQVNRHRLGYMGITLASLMMLAGVGNRVVDKYPDTFLANAVETIDQSIFSANSAEHIDPDEAETTQARSQKYRGVLGVGECLLAALLIIILLGTTCAGICYVIFAISGEIGAGFAFLGIAVTALSILGIRALAILCRDS